MTLSGVLQDVLQRWESVEVFVFGFKNKMAEYWIIGTVNDAENVYLIDTKILRNVFLIKNSKLII